MSRGASDTPAALLPFLSAVSRLNGEGRYLAAKQTIEEAGISPSSILSVEDRATIDFALIRSEEIKRALASSEGHDWTLGADISGIRTTYREESDNSISVNVEGVLDNNPVFEQFCATSDIERYSSWFPLCGFSKLHKKISLLENVIHASISTPFLSRDFVVKSWAADCLNENQSYIVFARSVDDSSGLGIELPAPAVTMFNDRARMNHFFCSFTVLSPTAVKIKMLLNAHLMISAQVDDIILYK